MRSESPSEGICDDTVKSFRVVFEHLDSRVRETFTEPFRVEHLHSRVRIFARNAGRVRFCEFA